MIETLKKIVDCFNGQVLKHNDELIGNQLAQAKNLSALNMSVERIEIKMETKQKLKERFIFLLNSYIKERDSFNMMTSSKEKEELAKLIRKQVELL